MENQQNQSMSFKRRVWITVAIVAFVAVLLMLVKSIFSILLLVLAGVLMAIYFHGCAAVLERYLKVPSKIATLTAVLINLVVMIGFFWFAGARLSHQVNDLSDKLPQIFNHFKDWIAHQPLGGKLLTYLQETDPSQKTIATAKTFLSSSFGILSDIYIIVLLGLFFTADPGTYKKGILLLIPDKRRPMAIKLLDKIHQVLKGWIKGQLFGFFFIGVLTGLGLWIIGVPLILTLALLAGLSNFVPNFGPVFALIPAFLLALMQDSTSAIIVVGLYAFIQFIQSAVTQPLIQQKMINIPPAIIIFAQVAMGLLCGFWGVLLATPVVAIIMTAVDLLYVNAQDEG